jgi:hypothetical protein
MLSDHTNYKRKPARLSILYRTVNQVATRRSSSMTTRDEFVRTKMISALQPQRAVGRERGWNGRQSFSLLLSLTVLLAALTPLGCSNSSGGSVQPPPPPIAHSVSLEWDDSASPVIGYNVYRGVASGGPYTVLSSALISATQYQDSSVQSGQTYYYVVTAVDSNEVESIYSNEVSATIPTP